MQQLLHIPLQNNFQVLDQEKSKLSLAQVYEEEYVKLAEGAEAAKTKSSVGLLDKDIEETPEAVKEIKVNISFFHY